MDELRETHISRVLLRGDRAYKLKKPLRLPFLDYGSLERRHELCREEVRLNRRLAPDVYRGVRALVPGPRGLVLRDEASAGAVEYVVEMRRYDESATLARRLDAGAAGETEVRAVGRRLAAFHTGAELPADPERAVSALEAMVAENFATLRSLGGDGEMLGAEQHAGAVLAGRRAELRRRAAGGLVRDGHGDLRAEHVVLERGIEIVDCVEFDPALREIDVGLDLAFLMMDLLRRDERLAAALVSAYREAGGDPGDDALVVFFAAQRALIRAKVALLRAGQVEGGDAARRRADAASLLDLGRRLGWRVRLGSAVVVCGLAASGKSTLAGALAERAGATLLSSDVVRKELLGLAATERAPASAYAPAMNQRTYGTLGRRARERTDGGGHVVVDATFRFGADRQAFIETLGAVPLWIECRAPAAVRARRAAARRERRDSVSDAGAAVAIAQESEWQPLEVPPERHLEIETDRDAAAALVAVRDALDCRLRRPAVNYAPTRRG
ncbi:MAG TPA: AAA family ATPase [Solirubrobacteraceae bacterium]|nr:AAA family ATPase [Solirubrobacteraceae bacterium]